MYSAVSQILLLLWATSFTLVLSELLTSSSPDRVCEQWLYNCLDKTERTKKAIRIKRVSFFVSFLNKTHSKIKVRWTFSSSGENFWVRHISWTKFCLGFTFTTFGFVRSESMYTRREFLFSHPKWHRQHEVTSWPFRCHLGNSNYLQQALMSSKNFPPCSVAVDLDFDFFCHKW